MSKTFKIVVLELGMLGGIIAAMFIVPPEFPLLWFLEISLGIFVIGNLLIFFQFRVQPPTVKYQMGTRERMGIWLLVLALAMELLVRLIWH